MIPTNLYIYSSSTYGVVVNIIGNGHSNMSSNPDCIFYSTNTLRRDMNSTNLPQAMGKIVGQTVLFSLGLVTCLGEGKTLNTNLLNST